jgi:hypothetical protein
MPRGGKREGAGRKPGTPGPGKGNYERTDCNRALAKATVTKVLTAERDPLFVLVDLAFDADNDVQVRKEAAIAALPYIHPRLSAIVTANVQQPVAADQSVLMGKLLGRIAKIEAARAPIIEVESEAA